MVGVRPWKSLELVISGHVMKKLEIPVTVGAFQLVHDEHEVFFSNVMLGKPRLKKGESREEMPRGIQSLLIVLHFGVSRSSSDICGQSPSRGVKRSRMLLRAVERESAP